MSNNNGKILLALLAGAAAGAAVGLLLAPEKGSATRKKIIDGAKDLADSLVEQAETSIGSISELKDKFTSKVSSSLENGISNARSSVKQSV